MYQVTQNLLKCISIRFAGLKPSSLTEDAGVYVLLLPKSNLQNNESLKKLDDYLRTIEYVGQEKGDYLLYVGRTTNRRVRLYQNHLQGTKATARLKVALVSHGIVATESDAKEFIKKYCNFKFLTLPNETTKEQYDFKLAEHQVKVDLKPVFID
ncbi:hypothetical protein [Rummeliibacillus pycnus]|uniref:hypothetical protein n=1 Tax=Rummeliibacillus pycnus TaxID=101070 RepID=UPI003D2DC03F